MTGPQPGDIIGGRWVIQGLIGEASDPAVPCDAAEYGGFPSIDSTGQCTCVVCARCGHHTGNGHQGHYWGFCQVTRTVRESHFCCPGPDGCSLEAAG